MSYHIFTDGASKGNPGPAAIGVACFQGSAPDLSVFKEKPEAVFTVSRQVGLRTNNEAEYLSLIEALLRLQEMKIDEATIHMDSELVIRQMLGVYKVKNPRLQPLFLEAQKLIRGKNFNFLHVPRDKNKIADYLANCAYHRS